MSGTGTSNTGTHDTGTYDVVVLGSGAAGLTAALRAAAAGASVGLFEKSDQVGGTSAWSGGMVWIPNNPHMPEIGIEDSAEEAMTYLRSLSQGLIDETLAGALVEAGPDLVRWLEATTPVGFRIIQGFPDYHPEHPGAKPGGGRSLECPLFPFDQLGDWRGRVTVGPQISGNITMSETSLGRGAPHGVPPEELARRRVHDERGAGQGLVAALLKGCLDQGVVPCTGVRAMELVTVAGRVTGVRLDSADGPFEVAARGGVILATGGFDWDPDLVKEFLRGPLVRSAAVPTNTGDGLRMAMKTGARLGTMREAWWVPIIDVVRPDGGVTAWQVNGERTRPHCIMVKKRGERFTNEAANYNALGAAFHVIDVTAFDYVNHPAWMIFDSFYLSSYGLAGFREGNGPTPDWMIRADTLAELAETLDVPEVAFMATVERWNAHRSRGGGPRLRPGAQCARPLVGRSEPSGTGWRRRSAQSTRRRTTRSGFIVARSAPRAARAPIRPVRWSTSTARPFPGSMPRERDGLSDGHDLRRCRRQLGPAMVFGYLAGGHAAQVARDAVGPTPP